ncbi:MAG TPA: hypothetical protein VN455_13650 [Methanotrichaceae archaeon]|nr:hypothetical protein [Methanotrichaceae archaeon]
MKTDKHEFIPLNGTSLAEIPIEELESRLESESLDTDNEMWTQCGCVADCGVIYTDGCPGYCQHVNACPEEHIC